MTAEVAILNKAVAVLAADSAMTLGGIEKVYPCDKLFPLTRSEPIGVMIYGDAEFMGVPWETLVKMYRRKRGEKSLPTVRAYMDDLLDFITDPAICTADAQRDSALAVVVDSFLQILDMVSGAVNDGQSPCGLLEDKIEVYMSILSEYEEHVSRSRAGKLISRLWPTVNEIIDDIFGQQLQVSETARTLLHSAARLTVERGRLSRATSGVVVAGFGEAELFPALVAVETDGFITSIRMKLLDETKIVRDVENVQDDERGTDLTRAAIVPFAQREMVEIFMDGVDPKFRYWLGFAPN